ncbi:hypothetical protein ACFQYP_02125 [Nonomuraea antimicrobica]
MSLTATATSPTPRSSVAVPEKVSGRRPYTSSWIGGTSMVASGATASTENGRQAGVGSAVPPVSLAVTWMPKSPAAVACQRQSHAVLSAERFAACLAYAPHVPSARHHSRETRSWMATQTSPTPVSSVAPPRKSIAPGFHTLWASGPVTVVSGGETGAAAMVAIKAAMPVNLVGKEDKRTPIPASPAGHHPMDSPL